MSGASSRRRGYHRRLDTHDKRPEHHLTSLIIRPGSTGHRPSSWRKHMKPVGIGECGTARPHLFQSPAPVVGFAVIVTTRTPVGSKSFRDREQAFGPRSKAEWGLMIEGYPANSIFHVHNMPERPFRYRRNVRWADLPQIFDPIYDYSIAAVAVVRDPLHEQVDTDENLKEVLHEKAMADSRRLSENLHEVRRVHVIKVSDNPLDLWHAIAPVVTNNPVALVSIAENGRHRYLSSDEIAELKRRHGIHDRLIYNHVFNMSILASRALFEAARRTDTTTWHLAHGPELYHESTMDSRRWDRFELFDPLFIQMLILMDATLGEPVDIRDGDDIAFGSITDALMRRPTIETTEKGEAFLVWRGTGKYGAMRVLLSAEKAVPFGSTLDAIRPLVRIGALTHVDGTLRITKFGHEVASLLGAAGRDPDVVLRWRTPEGLMASSEDGPEVDRWLVRYLRGVKRRMAPLSPYPRTEPDLPWGRPPVNLLVARGVTFAIADLDPSDAGRIVSEVESWATEKVITETQVGLMYNDALVEADRTPIAVWCGHVLAVVPERDPTRSQFNSSLDTSQLDAAVNATVSFWADKLGIAPSAIRFLHLPTNMPAQQIRTLSSKFENEDDGHAYAVYRGVLIDSRETVARWIASDDKALRPLIRKPWDRHPADHDCQVRLVATSSANRKGIVVGERIGVARFPHYRHWPSLLDRDAMISGVQLALDVDCAPLKPTMKLPLSEEMEAATNNQEKRFYAVGNHTVFEIVTGGTTGIVGAKRC